MSNNHKTLVFDIETIGEDFGDMDETTQSALTWWIKRSANSDGEYKAELENIKDRLGLSPLTGEVVVIGVMDVELDKGVIYFQSPGEDIEEFEEGGFTFKPMSEKEMLENFWKGVEKYNEFVSFNGRAFDVPFLMTRSAIHKIRSSKNLISNRYLFSQKYDAKHIDLLDQLTFYGATRKKPSLHLACRAFGVESPKTAGVTGDDVAKLFKEKKFIDIAKYNIRDLKATKALYEYWRDYLKI